MTFTVLLLFTGMVALGGCRKVVPPRHAWVHLDRLVALHPDQPMVVDLDRRLQTLQIQQQHLPGEGNFMPPPVAITHSTPESPALPEPQASPELDRHTDQFLAQRLEAYAQLLDRDRMKKKDIERRKYADEIAQQLDQARHQLASLADQQSKQIQQDYYMRLMNAKIALKSAKDLADENYSSTTAKQLDKAGIAYQAVNDAYHRKLARIAEKLHDTVRATEVDLTQQYAKKLELYDEQVLQLNDDLLKRKKAELTVAETGLQENVSPVPFTFSHPTSAGKPALNVPGLADHFHQAEYTRRHSRQAALQDINTVITKLRLERQQLLARTTRDTQEAVQVVAAQHGYLLSFDMQDGPDLTSQAQDWLGKYWQP